MTRRKDAYRPLDITTIEELRAAMGSFQHHSTDYGRPGDGDIGPAYYDAVPVPPDGYVPGELRRGSPPSATKAAFTSWRAVDPIRKTALECAAHLVTTTPTRPDESDYVRATRVMHVATMLEQYLTGEEANG